MFDDRFDAAQKLVEKLRKYSGKDAVVIAIPRGGLQIGSPLARALHLPLDVILIKKLGHPVNPEFAVGAVSLKGIVINKETKVPQSYIDDETKRLRVELEERQRKYGMEAINLNDKTVIIVDDGVATGSTLKATINMARLGIPKRIVVAIPVGAPNAVRELEELADEVICLHTPESFMAVGEFYREFPQVSDEEAIELLKKSKEVNV